MLFPLLLFIMFELEMIGTFVLYCIWGLQTLGEKALYYVKCCCLAVRGCWLHEIVIYSMAVGEE